MKAKKLFQQLEKSRENLVKEREQLRSFRETAEELDAGYEGVVEHLDAAIQVMKDTVDVGDKEKKDKKKKKR